MIIIGFAGMHDSSVCVVKDGRLLAAVSSERITRRKKDHMITPEVFDAVMQQAGIRAEDVDYLATQDYKSEYVPGLEIFDGEQQIHNTGERLFLNDTVTWRARWRGRELPIFLMSHHLAHAAAAYYTSPFERSVCFSMDSSGARIENNGIIALGEGLRLTALEHPGQMVGCAYHDFTHLLGLGNPTHKAGSTMGLASYGTAHEDLLKNLDYYVGRCLFKDTSYPDWWRQLFLHWSGRDRLDPSESSGALAQAMAATIQRLFEEAVLSTVRATEHLGTDNLCLSGGSLLNCTVNTRIQRETAYRHLHHFLACGDDGLCVGSALYLAHHVMGLPRQTYTPADLAYLGPDWQEAKAEPDYPEIARRLADGQVVGWYWGRSEYGPRALGHRSILADPRSPTMRDHLNFRVKNREWFRPFAPSVLADCANQWFDMQEASPYMLHTYRVLQEDRTPAISHVDTTARPQTVTEEDNPEYYRLIKEFYRQTGVPMVLNTSLNGNGEPICERPEDAEEMFRTHNLDAMVINGRLLVK
jgi:carbamoyltransferase